VLLRAADEGVQIPGSDGDGQWWSMVVKASRGDGGGESESRATRGCEEEAKSWRVSSASPRAR
jgi:hypothetical protein